jgi:hypothetical protein
VEYSEKVERLNTLVRQAESSYAVALALSKSLGTATPVRHKCFITYHGADIDPVTKFVEDYSDVFVPRVLGASDSDQFKDPIDSEGENYIKAQIGSKYLSDSTVTILFVGKGAWSRKYVDWELSSTLRDDPVNKRNGLLAITPADNSLNKLPARFNDNYIKDGESYALYYYYYPTSAANLRRWIEDAFQARTNRAGLIKNSRHLRRADSPC